MTDDDLWAVQEVLYAQQTKKKTTLQAYMNMNNAP